MNDRYSGPVDGPLLRLEAVSKHYSLGETTTSALQNVSMDVAPGEVLFVWGPSGAGKSTLLNVVALLDDPTEGRILVDGKDTGTLSDTEKTRLLGVLIGFIFQSFNLVPVLTAIENVALPLVIRGTPAKQARERAKAMLDEVGMADFVNQGVTKLSGGQRQRVAIARALIAQPRIIIADEPTANLDSANSERILSLLLRLNRVHGTTLIVVTPARSLERAATRQIHMKDGRLVEATADAERIKEVV